MRRLFTSLRAIGATLLIGLLGVGAAGSGEYAKPSVPSRAAVVLGNRNPYTPQMVVDGSVEFSGGRVEQALQSIAAAAEQAKVPVTLAEASRDKPGKENFSVEVAKLLAPPKGGAAEVWLAITEIGRAHV